MLREGPRSRVFAFVSDIRFIKANDFDRIRAFWGGARVEQTFGWEVVRVNTSVGVPSDLARAIDELRRLGPDAVAVAGEPEAVAIHNALPTTPIIFGSNVDPVELGLTDPHANGDVYATGFSFDDVRYVRPVQIGAECCRQYGFLPIISVLAEQNWLTWRRVSLWREVAQFANVDIRFYGHSSPDSAFDEILKLSQNGCRVCITPHSLATVLSPRLLSQAISRVNAVQISERIATLSTGAAFAYEDTLSDWQPTMGQMIRMVMEGESVANIPVRTPDAWKWGVNRASLRSLGLGKFSALTDEFVVSVES